MLKTIEETFKKLDDIAHALHRPGRYIGSINPHTANTFIHEPIEKKFVKKELSYCPGLLKVFDEVISNSIDFSKRPDGSHLDTIKVTIDKGTGKITVFDNGGITVVKHKEYNQWIPEMIFELKSGSNFDDDSDDGFSAGQNGEGASLTAIFATEFNVVTSDGTNSFNQTHSNNSRLKTEPVITKSKKRFTEISWIPDYPRFNLETLDQDNYDRLVKRVYDVAGCNPKLKIYLNGELIKIDSYKNYISMYCDNYAIDETDTWKIAVTSAINGFDHVSFVNGTETFVGGTHIDYVTNQIVSKLKVHFSKKHKIDVKPADIKNHLQLFIVASIAKPRYSSQTKEQLITEPKAYQTEWVCDDKFIKKVLELDAIQSILDWVKAKEQAAISAELRKHSKLINKNDPKNVPKFHDATSKNRSETSLFLVEGDCLEENTLVPIRTDNGFISKKIKDVEIGEEVITHKGNIKPIIEKQHRLKNTISITTNLGTIESSYEHKFFVYDTITKTFEFIVASELDANVHKLVKGKYLDYDYVQKIDEIIELVDDMYSLEFRFNVDGIDKFIKSTDSHKFGCLDIIYGQFVFIEAKDIMVNRHVFLCMYV